jgi:hypothetical protein
MAKCKHRDQPGGPETCGLLAAENSEYCPRHRFLHAIAAEKRRDKEIAQREKKGYSGLPKTREEMLRRGYEYRGTEKCRGCSRVIEMWLTPNARIAPYDPMPELQSHSVSHFATCSRAASFRRAG